MNMEIKYYYLGTPLECYEYVRIPISMVPEEILTEYSLHALIHDGYIYVEVRKGMYGSPQAGLLANILLAKARQAWIQPIPSHSRIMDAHVAPHQILTCGR
jgi:hypothetical protein